MQIDCPVCRSSATLEPKTGDFSRITCPRCGAFQISGSAEAMLPSRLDRDDVAWARLSHALRIGAAAGTPQMVTSGNLDELVTRRLPGMAETLPRLLRIIGGRLADHHHGTVVLDPAAVASLVGVVNERDVAELVADGIRKELIKPGARDLEVGLTGQGWAAIDGGNHGTQGGGAYRPPASDTRERQHPPAPKQRAMVLADCNNCGPGRRADVLSRTEHERPLGEDSWIKEVFTVLECRGCGIPFVKREITCSEWEDVQHDPFTGEESLYIPVEIAYWPARSARQKPTWVATLEDEALRQAVEEVYEALDHDLLMLAAIGVRTAFDRASVILLERDAGSFRRKLEETEKAGHLTAQQRQALEIVTDAGNAAAHRAFRPTAESVNTCVIVIERFLEQAFVLAAAATKVKRETPQR